MSIGIYKITSPTNKIYIGQSINIERRYKEYSKSNCKNQTKLFLSLKKYGFENHKFEIVEECNVSFLEERETYWKLFYKVLEVPSLCCRIDGKFGYLSQETKDKISKGLLGTVRSKTTRQSISNNMPNKKKVYQFNIKGELLNVWDSIKEVERKFKGNIKNNILGKIKQSGGFIFLREEDIHTIEERINNIKNFKHPLNNRTITSSTRYKISKSNLGKTYKTKISQLDLGIIEKQYKTLTPKEIAILYNISLPTMISYLKLNNIYQFRKNKK